MAGSRFPPTRKSPRGTGDFTYGGIFQTPTATLSVGTLAGGIILSNAEVIAILMDVTNYPNGRRCRRT